MPHRKRCIDRIAGEVGTTEPCAPDRVPLLLNRAVAASVISRFCLGFFYNVLEEGASVPLMAITIVIVCLVALLPFGRVISGVVVP